MVEVKEDRNRQLDEFLESSGKRYGFVAWTNDRGPEYHLPESMKNALNLHKLPKAQMIYTQSHIHAIAVALVTKIPDLTHKSVIDNDAGSELEMYVLDETRENSCMKICAEFEELFNGKATLVRYYQKLPNENPLRND